MGASVPFPVAIFRPPSCGRKSCDRTWLVLQAFFAHAATTIQRWWRGYWSRMHIHSYYARKAYLQAVCSRNKIVRMEMEKVRAGKGGRRGMSMLSRCCRADVTTLAPTGLQDMKTVLEQQREHAREKAKSEFEMKIHSMQHMLSTCSRPGLLNPPVAVATGSLPAVGGISLEEHIRRSGRQQVRYMCCLISHTCTHLAPYGGVLPMLCSGGFKCGGNHDQHQLASPGIDQHRSQDQQCK